jgi:hypothetical protein
MPDYKPLPFSREEYNRKNVPQTHGHEAHAQGAAHETHGTPAPEHGAEKAVEKKGAH